MSAVVDGPVVDGPVGGEVYVPGARQQTIGNRWIGATVAVVALAIFVPQLVPLRHPYLLHIISVLAVAILCERAAIANHRGWQILKYSYHSLNGQLEKVQDTNQHYHDFVSAFPVEVAQVGNTLKADAMLVNDAHQAKVNFYREYRGFNAHEPSGDPEASATKLKEQFAQVEAELERHVKESLAEFRRKRALAKWRSFSVWDSWKNYVGIQKTDTGLVEGRNEPPGQ